VVSQRSDEDLGLVFQATKGLAVDDPVPVALERGARRARLLRLKPPLGQPALGSIGREALLFLLQPRAYLQMWSIHYSPFA
jgi:hypothetical protein